ncbi:MAG: HNH endonuclease signature motif containing protein, partial [Dermatophilaceae bacterium]
LAAVEEVVTEDGVVGEQVNGLGAVCLDAGAMVATATGTSSRFGEELVEQAVTRVVRVPALHEAMLAGVLDEYKARRLAGELGDVPPDLARAVVDALAGDLAVKSGPALQRKARTIVMSLCPELLRERIRRSRRGVGLRRWVGEPGTDAWGGSFPSERAARAWAGIDALARRYRVEGRYETLEQARAYALMDLVEGDITVETVLHLSVPAEGLTEAAAAATPAAAEEGGAGSVVSAQAQAAGGGPVHVGAGSGGAAFLRPRDPDGSGPESSGEGRVSGEVFVAVAGAQGQALSWVPVGALRSCSRDGGAVVCDPWTGALLDVGDGLASAVYRPGERLKRLVRQRDGGCRFPGCTVSARQCDLDHVVAWPHGPTAASNLICLCRRHHRVKQRHRWRVSLGADGVVEWLDPAGRLHRSEPVDHLGATHERVLDTAAGHIPGHVASHSSDGGDGGGDDVDGDLAAVEDVGSSMLEQWLAVVVEHATGSTARRSAGSAVVSSTRGLLSAADGWRGRCPTALSGAEIDELSRAVRGGRFADIEDAVRNRHAAAADQAATRRQQQSRQGCRIDHHLPTHEHTIKIKIKGQGKGKTRRAHPDRHAPTPPAQTPPPF